MDNYDDLEEELVEDYPQPRNILYRGDWRTRREVAAMMGDKPWYTVKFGIWFRAVVDE